MAMTEAKAQEICKATDLSQYSYSTLSDVDNWVKSFALAKLETKLAPAAPAVRAYVLLMARCHYGSVETDEFLKGLNCYPDWLNEKETTMPQGGGN